MQTGENEQGLRKILDMTRMAALLLLLFHFYINCYQAFVIWHWTHPKVDLVLTRLLRVHWLGHPWSIKSAALLCLSISLLGARGRKQEKSSYRLPLMLLCIGTVLYYGIAGWLWLPMKIEILAGGYMAGSSVGFLLILAGGLRITRIVKQKLDDRDIFNKINQTFPQEERLLQNEYSINLPATYNWKGRWRKSWINIINPFRGVLVLGSPGSGKTFFVIRHLITQHMEKGFSMFVYDFKFDDLSRIVYNSWLQNRHKYLVPPGFFVINFEDLSRSHRCNPLEQESMLDITDAAESARTILLGLNREWIKRQGDFFIESPINFLTAIIWFLRKYQDGQYCTLPHVIELMQVGYDELFTVLRTQKEIEALINPFVNAYLNDVMEQLEGQIASAKIALARLSSPQLYYILSGNDFTLDINNPKAPKILCMGNNPQKIQIYGAVLSLYVNRLIKQVNRKGMLKSSLIFDEFPTIYLSNIDSLIATARSNRVATCLGIQDFSQLRKDYGREQADVIANITGNVISGQVSGETARHLSERFGKIQQNRESLSISSQDVSVSKSKQLDTVIPPSIISSLSSGEFVGAVADNPDCPIEQKAFHCRIESDPVRINAEEKLYQEMEIVRAVAPGQIERVFASIREDIAGIVQQVMDEVSGDPQKRGLLIKKDG